MPNTTLITPSIREALIDALIDSWGLPHLKRSALTREAATRDIDAILTALASQLDPADLPARMTTRLIRACSHFADDPECAKMTAAAVMQERWDTAAQAAAEADLYRREHSDMAGQALALRERATEWRQKHDAARRERDELSQTLDATMRNFEAYVEEHPAGDE